MSQSVRMDCEDSINLSKIPKTLFCICCLRQTGSYVKLGACSHREYLESFPIPVGPSVPETVCISCHDTLKKVARFKLQVQQSFSMLEKKVENIEKITSLKTNLKISKTCHLNIPELIEHGKEELEGESDKVKKMKNIKTALEILNNNTSSLQLLSSCQNFIGLTESLLEVTSNNLNLSLSSTPVPPESNIKKKSSSHHGTPVLPDEIKKEPEDEIDVVDEKLEIMSYNHKDNDEDPSIIKDLSYNSVVSPKYTYENPEIQDDLEKSYFSINNKHTITNDSKTIVLPKENKIECDDVTYGKIKLPDVMTEYPENLDEGLTTIGNCLGEIKQKDYNTRPSKSRSIVNNSASQEKRRPPSLCLIPIKLNKRELQTERQEKSNSSEFLRMEYRCKECITGFVFKENLDDHVKRKHIMRNPETHVTCEICCQVVLLGEVREHKFRHYHRLECKKCKKRFVLFDEAFDHYSSVHTPLHNKNMIKRQLQSYIRSKRLNKKRNVIKCNTKSITCTTTEGGSTDCTETLPKS